MDMTFVFYRQLKAYFSRSFLDDHRILQQMHTQSQRFPRIWPATIVAREATNMDVKWLICGTLLLANPLLSNCMVHCVHVHKCWSFSCMFHSIEQYGCWKLSVA